LALTVTATWRHARPNMYQRQRVKFLQLLINAIYEQRHLQQSCQLCFTSRSVATILTRCELHSLLNYDCFSGRNAAAGCIIDTVLRQASEDNVSTAVQSVN
jgi:hypothetical protein